MHIRNSLFARFRIALPVLALYLAFGVLGANPAGSTNSRQTPKSTGRNVIITLQDHSTLFGRIVSLKSRTIQVRTATLGTLTIPVNSIRSIRFNEVQRERRGRASLADSTRVKPKHRPAASPASTAVLPQKIAGVEFGKLMQGITENAGLMRQISQLQNDPEIRSVIQDPGVVRAVQNGDILSLMKNPKVLRLLNNDKLRKLSREALKGQ